MLDESSVACSDQADSGGFICGDPAIADQHGVREFLVRGLAKVTTVVVLAAIASNLLQHATALLA